MGNCCGYSERVRSLHGDFCDMYKVLIYSLSPFKEETLWLYQFYGIKKYKNEQIILFNNFRIINYLRILIIFVLNRTKFKNSMLVEECYTLCMLKIETMDCVHKRHKISKI